MASTLRKMEIREGNEIRRQDEEYEEETKSLREHVEKRNQILLEAQKSAIVFKETNRLRDLALLKVMRRTFIVRGSISVPQLACVIHI